MLLTTQRRSPCWDCGSSASLRTVATLTSFVYISAHEDDPKLVYVAAFLIVALREKRQAKMDPTSSIITIVATSYKALKYINDVRDGGKERSALSTEALELHDTLLRMQDQFGSHDLHDGSTWARSISSLFQLHGPAEQLKSTLDDIVARIEVPPGRSVKAFARRLKWPFEKYEAQRLCDRLRSLKDTFVLALGRANLEIGLDSNEKIVFLTDAVKAVQLQTALQSISPTDFRALQQSESKRPLQETGQWFLSNAQVQGWADHRHPVLWCHGIPGAGKTMLASAAYQMVQARYHDTNVVVAVAFCSFDDPNTHTAYQILYSRQTRRAFHGSPINVCRQFGWR